LWLILYIYIYIHTYIYIYMYILLSESRKQSCKYDIDLRRKSWRWRFASHQNGNGQNHSEVGPNTTDQICTPEGHNLKASIICPSIKIFILIFKIQSYCQNTYKQIRSSLRPIMVADMGQGEAMYVGGESKCALLRFCLWDLPTPGVGNKIKCI
jgi:hypothetical protein